MGILKGILLLFLLLVVMFSPQATEVSVSRPSWSDRKLGLFFSGPARVPAQCSYGPCSLDMPAEEFVKEYFDLPPYYAHLEMVLPNGPSQISSETANMKEVAFLASAHPEVEISFMLSFDLNSETDWRIAASFVNNMTGLKSVFSIGFDWEATNIWCNKNQGLTGNCAYSPDVRKSQSDRMLSIVKNAGFNFVSYYESGSGLNNATVTYQKDYLWIGQSNFPAGDSSFAVTSFKSANYVGAGFGGASPNIVPYPDEPLRFYCSRFGNYPYYRNITVPPDTIPDPNVNTQDRYCSPSDSLSLRYNRSVIDFILGQRAEINSSEAHFTNLFGPNSVALSNGTSIPLWLDPRFREDAWELVSQKYTGSFNWVGKGQCNSAVADVNSDGTVDLGDLRQVAGAFGKNAGGIGYNARLDVNRDGKISISDLVCVAVNVPGLLITILLLIIAIPAAILGIWKYRARHRKSPQALEVTKEEPLIISNNIGDNR